MHGSVLAVLNTPDTARACLDAAAEVATALSDAHVAALCIRVDPLYNFLPSEEVMTRERRAQLRGLSAERTRAVHVIYEAWCERHPGIAPSRSSWSEPEGAVPQLVRKRGRNADLIVLAPPADIRDLYGREALKAAIFDADRPVLVVPAIAVDGIGRSIAILWDEEEPTLKAVLDAMPLLAAAKRVFVLCRSGRGGPLAPAPPVSPVLSDHGVNAECVSVDASVGPAAEALLASAHGLGADLIVMGAYPRQPIAELLFGGMTRYLLSHSDLPVLLRH